MTASQRPVLSARDNPFAMHRVESIPYRFAVGTWDTWLGQLQSMGWRGAIVGKQGAGKTTLMLELKTRLECGRIKGITPHYCFLSRKRSDHEKEIGHLVDAANRGCLLLVDGIERLGWLERRRLLRYDLDRTALVVTSHESAWMPVWIHCRTDWQLMKSVLEDLVDSPDHALVRETRRLFQLHRGNIRDVLRGLYDFCSVFESEFDRGASG